MLGVRAEHGRTQTGTDGQDADTAPMKRLATKGGLGDNEMA